MDKYLILFYFNRKKVSNKLNLITTPLLYVIDEINFLFFKFQTRTRNLVRVWNLKGSRILQMKE